MFRPSSLLSRGALWLALVGAVAAGERRYAYAPLAEEDALAVWLVEDDGMRLVPAGEARHPVGTRAVAQVALHASGDFVYVVNGRDHGASEVSLHRIDRRTGRLEYRSALHTATGPLHIALTPDGRLAYLVEQDARTLRLFEVDAHQGTWRERHTPMPTGEGPCQVLLDPLGRFVFVVNRVSCSVSRYRLDERGRPELAGEDVLLNGSLPNEACIAPAGDRLYVTLDTYDLLLAMAIDPHDGGLRTINAAATGRQPQGLALDPLRQRLYVAEAGSDSLSAFDVDPATGRLGARLGPFSAGASPRDVTLAPGTDRLWSCGNEGAVRAFRLDAASALTPDGLVGGPGTLRGLIGLEGTVRCPTRDLEVALRPGGALAVAPAGAGAAAGAGQVVAGLDGAELVFADPQGTWVLAVDRQPARAWLVRVGPDGRLGRPGPALALGDALSAAPGAVAVSPCGTRVAFVTSSPPRLATCAVPPGRAELTLVHGIPLRHSPDSVAFAASGRTLVVTHPLADRVTVAPLDEFGFLGAPKVHEVRGGPGPLAVGPSERTVFVGLSGARSVVPCELDGAAADLVVRAGLGLELEAAPSALACDPLDGAVLVRFAAGGGARLERHPRTRALKLAAALPAGLGTEPAGCAVARLAVGLVDSGARVTQGP